ncbi:MULTISPECIES: Lrp/AsnC family transcriptional regulator [unclassified Pseudoclavibacter]|uniref:Lrp/AsnC family transcriptional regulator n=1 Tax=unclassified Pseudoclavibacter TaxID=2615177 RepID=UPI0012F13540|nr:AsnC family transcriptional regulator [Pseudoclavibacter sp. 8L]
MGETPKELRAVDAGMLDEVDRRLVELLQANSRQSNTQLATAVGIAQSTCIARVRSLVDRGIITRFTADVGLPQLGLALQALISVNIRSGQRQELAHFAEEMRALPEVVQIFFLGGSEDFIVHVAVRDSNDAREFVVANLSTHPAVASTRTSIVFDHHRIR